MHQVIGVDFDNTIIGYDDLLFRLAVERRLIPFDARRGKKAIRDRIRLDHGDIEWQKLQAEMYGPRIGEAVLIDGVNDFFRACRKHGVPVYIVSHKTAFSNLSGAGANFHDAATGWLRLHGFFNADGLGLSERQVFYKPTLPEKVAQISRLKCTHFIDDLEETFHEAGFPAGVRKLLFNPHHETSELNGVECYRDWSRIRASIFHD
jgi:hypothetical protein